MDISHDNYSDVFQDMDIPKNVPIEQVMELLDRMVKEIFLETFERAFGRPDESVAERVTLAHLGEVKEWISNLVDAKEPSDVFVSFRERVIAQFVADVINRKHGGNLDIAEVKKLRDILDNLQAGGNRDPLDVCGGPEDS